MVWRIDIDPLLAWPYLSALALAAILIAALLLLARTRGAIVRSLALALGLIALINPVFIEEEREPLSSIAALVVDRSDSQSLGDRKSQTNKALEDLEAQLSAIPNLDLRIVETNGRNKKREGTALFGALQKELSDVPPDRIAGAILLSDGQVHDVPSNAADLGFNAPLHTLLTGEEDEFDQRLVLTEAPRFGIVGEEKEIKFRVETTDNARHPTANVSINLNGETTIADSVPVGQEITLAIEVDRGGQNILEIAVEEVPGELTAINNTAVQTIEGIRENLRVLLVSGEPHPGERTWRNLLKSDATVDLVHFTILRPPEKQDGTPINQLSLIAFPTRELFSVKINEFDLIIFDRYQRRGVLPVLYFDNIARYVQDGGAILIAAGPDYADPNSIFQTPLAPVLPAQPIGSVYEDPFYAEVTKAGYRHPVTRNLEGAKAEPPAWSRWFRIIDVDEPRGNVVMSGPDERPLLVLNREEEGRVALMLSDHAWLWARGFEGGGPHVQLLRRLSHWLMKEPDLEEEALRGFVDGNDLVIERQTMIEAQEGAAPSTIEIKTPIGESIDLKMSEQEPGLLTGRLKTPAPGLYEITDGDLKSLAHMGPPNPKEFQDVVSGDAKLSPLAKASGGSIVRASDGAPRIVALNNVGGRNRALGGRDWFGLKMTDASILKGVNRLSLFAGFLGLAFLLTALTAMWYREGR